MPTNSPNFNIPKPVASDVFNLTNFNGILDAIDTNVKTAMDTQNNDATAHVRFGVATGVANTYAVTLTPTPTLVDGLAVSVRINVDSTAASTLNVNGLGAKPLKKANGSDITNLKANGVYTFRYNSSTGNFIVQGEGGAGNAVASDLLAGKTASTDAGDITGTMPNNGAVTITPGTANQTITAGYHNGSGVVNGDPDLVSGNIKAGVNIFGVVGSTNVVDTTTGTGATAANVLSGKTAYVNGASVTGTMPNKVGSATVITPSASDQAIPQGYFGGVVGDGKVAAVTFNAANVLTGTTIAGTAGTMANRGAVTITPGTTNQTIAAGYHNGSGTVAGDPDLIASNIKSGVDIFGVVGNVTVSSLGGANKANGSGTVSTLTTTVNGLTFLPSLIFVEVTNGTQKARFYYASPQVWTSDLSKDINDFGITIDTSVTSQPQGYNMNGGSWTVSSTSFSFSQNRLTGAFTWRAYG